MSLRVSGLGVKGFRVHGFSVYSLVSSNLNFEKTSAFVLPLSLSVVLFFCQGS